MYTFIVNPNSRSNSGHLIWARIEPVLRLQKIQYEVYFTQYQKHATQIAKAVTGDGCEHTLIAVGGDGTVNEVINGICDFEKTKFGYIPSGSGNDFAKGLSLPTDPLEALDRILRPQKILTLDLGQTSNGHSLKKYFAFSSGIGFDAAVCHQSMVSRIKSVLNRFHLGKLTYALIAVGRLIFLEPAVLTVTLDDGTVSVYEKTAFAAAMNLPYEGGGFKFCPDASFHDGKLDLFVVSGLSRLSVVFVLLPALFGCRTFSRHAQIIRCQKAHLISSIALPVHTDGEPVAAQSDLTFSITADKLNVLS